MRFCFGCLLLAGVVFTGAAQPTTVLDNNPNLKWLQINTDHFKVIFPDGYDVQAQRMANTLEHIRVPETQTLRSNPRKISIILQNQSAISNGFVSITPRRSEFFGMPSQNYNFQGNLDWLDLLATHEYRHIVQFQQANQGFNRFLYYLFGANTLAAMSHIAVPQWFWEGDAVVMETALTQGGRGRIPNFELLFRTNLQEKRVFNYHKQYLRSYKHNIPDHYVLGYQLVSYLRKRTQNPHVWDNITRNAWSKSILPFTFSNSIKKETGMHVTDLYKAMAADLQTEWNAVQATLKYSPFESLVKRKNSTYTDYRFPIEIAPDSVIALKSGIGNIEELVLLAGGEEKRIWTPGILNQTAMLSGAQGKIVWNEYRYDPRWRMKTYSVIMSFDVKTRARKPLSMHSRYAGAALSPDGKKVATIETTTDYLTRLVVLDVETGNLLTKIENPQAYFISMPHWRNNHEVIVLLTNKMTKALGVIDITKGSITPISEFTEENMGYPVAFQHYVLYNSPRSGIDNIYALDTRTGNRFQITSSKYGAYNPAISIDGTTLYYNEQGRDGMDVVKIDLTPTSWKPASDLKYSPYVQTLTEQEGHAHVLDSVPDQKYETRKYAEFTHLINPHSWGAYVNSNLTEIDIGITSRDVLSTTAINAGYLFDINERTGSWNAGISYQGFYPIIDVNFSKATRSVNEGDLTYDKITGTDTVSVTENLTFDWKETSVEAGLRLPLVTTSSRFIGNFTVFNYVGYRHITNFENSIDGGGRLLPSNYPQYFFRNYADEGNLIYDHFGMSAYRLLKRSRRDINSKWGQAFFLDYYATTPNGDYEGRQFSFLGQLYFPGLFKHHSFWGYWAYQGSLISDVRLSTQQGLDNYTFRNEIPLPRGQSVSRFEKFYSMSANYTMPIWYPDVNIGPLLNIQRVRANAFFDYGFGSSVINNRPFSQTYLSTGAEVKFDINVFRLLPQLDVGFRYSYGIDPSTSRFEFLLGTLNF